MSTHNHDWERLGTEHLEREGCIINIREGLTNTEGQAVTSIEVIPDEGWQLDGKINTRVIKEVSG